MTDAQAIVQVNAMAAETQTAVDEVNTAYSDADSAKSSLQNAISDFNSLSGLRNSGLAYVLNNYGS